MIKMLTAILVLLLAFQFGFRIFCSGDATLGSVNLMIHLLIWFTIAVWFLLCFLQNKIVINIYGIEPFLFSFLIAILLSTVFSSYKYEAVLNSFAYVSYIMLLLLFLNIPGQISKPVLVNLLMSAGLVLVIYSLMQYFFIFDIIKETINKRPEFLRLCEETREEIIRRISSKEVFSTFVLPNTFAGFLVLLIPFVAGLLIDAFRQRHYLYLVSQGIFLLVSLFALRITGSTGAMVSLAFASLAFVALYLWHKNLKMRRFILIAGGVFIIGVILLLLNFEFIARMSETMRVRGIYWAAALKTIWAHPFFGVGLNNFQDFYTKYKSEYQTEVIRVHNDYLQIGADTGLIGLISFCLLLGFVIIRMLKMQLQVRQSENEHNVTGYIIAGFCFSFITAINLKGTFTEIEGSMAVPVILFVLWLIYAIVTFPVISRLNLDFARVGVCAGFIGFLCHIFVDFNFSTYEIAETVFCVIGTILVLWPKRLYIQYPRWVALTGLVIVFVVMAIVGGVFLPRVSASEESYARAMELANKNKPVEEVLAHFESAQANNPLDAKLYMEPAMYCFAIAEKIKEDQLKEKLIEQGIFYAQKASRIRPYNSGIWEHLADATYKLYQLYIARARDPSDISAAMARGYLSRGLECAEKAKELYPTKARVRFIVGRYYWANGDIQKAREEFDYAIYLSDLARGKRLDPSKRWRLELSPEELKIIEECLNKKQ